MPQKARDATATTAGRQVWILAGLGLAGGALFLAVFGWVLNSTQRGREEIDRAPPIRRVSRSSGPCSEG